MLTGLFQKTGTVSNSQHISTKGPNSIVIIGAGNVASTLARKLHEAGHRILCIYARREAPAATLAGELNTIGTSGTEAVPGRADFYILAVSDDAIPGVTEQFGNTRGTWLHTSGAVPMDIFRNRRENFGVLYPLQSLSREREVFPAQIPFLVEGSSPTVTHSIRQLALSISDRVIEMDSKARLLVHLAAVFANNFSNHMVIIARKIMARQQTDPDLLIPLLRETFSRIEQMGPERAQTGPAIRGDEDTIRRHLELLGDDPHWKKIYTFISRDIQRGRQ